MTQFIRIVEWSKYQHYKERNPPWIKLHRGTLSSETWVTLDDASRVLAVAIMLLAAEKENKVPAKPEYLKRVAYLHGEPDLRPLVEVGFIEIIEENGETASTTLAHAITAQADARPEGETEERQSRAELKGAQARSKRGSRLPEGWEPSPAGVEFAKGLGLDPIQTLPAFRDHWTAATGQKASKLDWDAAWRTWCRNEVNFSRNKPKAETVVKFQPQEVRDAQRHMAFAALIAKGMSPGMSFSAIDRNQMIAAGMVTLEQCQRAGCAA